MKNATIIDEISTIFNVDEKELRELATVELEKRRQRDFLLSEPFAFHKELLCPPQFQSYLRPFHKEGLEWLHAGTKRLKLILWPRGHL